MRPRTITFNPDQMELIATLLEREMEDYEGTDPTHIPNVRQLCNLFLPGLWLELYRSVEQDKGDRDNCREHTFSKAEIRRFIEAELTEAWEEKYLKGVRKRDIPKLARKFRWEGEPEFLEFDSSNDSHACGYWELRIQGPDELEEAIEDWRNAV